jgi:hypothetical protein
MAELITTKQREEAEFLIYKVMDKVDPSHTNSDYYRELFSKMDNNKFYHFFERRLPIRFHYQPFKIEPKIEEIIDAFKVMNKPLIEKVNMPHIYKNADGVPVQSEECLVIYLNIKRMQQMVAKKSHVFPNIDKRDMKTGLLTGEDKGAKETDREFEALAAYGLDYTIDEFSRVRADSVKAAAEMNSIISAKGFVSENDFVVGKYDSIGKNLLNVYLIGANIHSNLIDVNYYTAYTVQRKKK